MKNYLTKLFVVATTFISVVSAQHNLEVVGIDKELIRLSNNYYITTSSTQEGMLNVGDKLEFSDRAFNALINFDLILDSFEALINLEEMTSDEDFDYIYRPTQAGPIPKIPLKTVKCYCERLETEMKVLPVAKELQGIKIRRILAGQKIEKEDFDQIEKEDLDKILDNVCFISNISVVPNDIFDIKQTFDSLDSLLLQFVLLEDGRIGLLCTFGDEERLLSSEVSISKYVSAIDTPPYAGSPKAFFISLGKIHSETMADGTISDSILDGTIVNIEADETIVSAKEYEYYSPFSFVKGIDMLVSGMEKSIPLKTDDIVSFDFSDATIGDRITYVEVDFSDLSHFITMLKYCENLMNGLSDEELLIFNEIQEYFAKKRAVIFSENWDDDPFYFVEPIDWCVLEGDMTHRSMEKVTEEIVEGE